MIHQSQSRIATGPPNGFPPQSLHRYSPGGEYEVNEYGGLPVKPVVFAIMLYCTAIRC
jgi:hypothetical protein